MSLAPAEKISPAPPPAGGVHFAAAAQHAELSTELRARRYLVAAVPSAERGRLRHAIDEAVEGALAMRGALPSAVHLDAGLEPTIRDQVFRARALGATGLSVMLPPLRSACAEGALDAADSATLLAWLGFTRRAPLLLLLDEADRGARVLSPTPLADLAGASPLGSTHDSAPPPSGEIDTLDGSARTPPPPVIAMPRRGVMKKRSALRDVGEGAPVARPSRIMADRAEGPPAAEVAQRVASLMPPAPPLDVELEVETAVEAKPPAVEEPAPVAIAAPPPPPVEEEIEPDPPTTPRPPMVATRPTLVARRTALAPKRAPVEAPRAPDPEPQEDVLGLDPEPLVTERVAEPPVELPRVAEARRMVDVAEYRTHAIELDKARGPKPVAVIEKLFVTRYAPLVGAVARGDADNAVRGVVDTWRTAFEHSYRDAFSALRVTGKRPPMVFDAPDIAARIGRLNSARMVKLLLVDSMRFDVGERVAERLKDKLVGRAVCVERMLLWAALPTTTPAQLALLGRGADGLRDGEPVHEPEPDIVRGRAVSTLRRERVGSREVMKLDLVEARLRSSGPAYDERLDALADEVAPVLMKFIETLPPRTLLFIFGDHGFRLPAGPDGKTTGAATQGGTSPEEVLVPGQAWLVGGVH